MEETSRTQKKKEALALQELGEKLVRLPEDRIGLVPLPAEILDAVMLARRIKKRGGLKRQMQHIGALMRRIDPGPIREAVRKIEEGSREQAEMHKRVERWRDALLGGSDEALGEIFAAIPGIDRQQLSDLVRKARAEVLKTQSSPAPARALFRFLFASATIPGTRTG